MNHTIYLVGMIVLTIAYAIALAFAVRRKRHESTRLGKVALGFTANGVLLGLFLERILDAL